MADIHLYVQRTEELINVNKLDPSRNEKKTYIN